MGNVPITSEIQKIKISIHQQLGSRINSNEKPWFHFVVEHLLILKKSIIPEQAEPPFGLTDEKVIWRFIRYYKHLAKHYGLFHYPLLLCELLVFLPPFANIEVWSRDNQRKLHLLEHHLFRTISFYQE